MRSNSHLRPWQLVALRLECGKGGRGDRATKCLDMMLGQAIGGSFGNMFSVAGVKVLVGRVASGSRGTGRGE